MKYLAGALLLLSAITVHAQDFEYGKLDGAELVMKKYDKDTTAHAVVLREYGKTLVSTQDHLPVWFNYHVKIKIFDSKGFNKGNVEVELYKSDNNTFETVEDIKGTTYYTDEAGVIRRTDLDLTNVFRENVDKHHELVKFALPNLHDGCVIEYTYTTESPYHFNFHGWEFQSDIPKIYSEYEAHIPAVYDYNTALRVNLKLTTNNAKLDADCFIYYGIKADCSVITYAMKDIPAFKEESYMTAPKNYLSALYYELAAQSDEYGQMRKVTKDWVDADKQLKEEDDLGGQLKRKDLLKDYLPKTILSQTDTLNKAKEVYTFIQKQFKWDEGYNIFTENGIKKAFEAHTGNSADINLSLVTALNAAGINADAVLLSTRDYGVVNKLFPVISEFNYVIAKVDINNQTYLLDATDPLLPFGLLPLRCINDQGRVMSLKKPSYWIDLVQTQKKQSSAVINLNLQPDGKVKGTITEYLLGYEGYEKRQATKKYNTMDEYMEKFASDLHNIRITKWKIEGIDSLDQPVTETFDVELKTDNKLNTGDITINPAFWDEITQNPFTLQERNYPVDMGAVTKQNLVVSITYPDGYTLTSKPEPVGMSLPYNGGMFVTSVDVDQNMVKYAQSVDLKKAIYLPQEYPYLKELYNKIIQNQKATIVFTKK